MASIGDIDFPLNHEQACGGGPPTYLLLILIHTSFQNYDRREASRGTWTAKNETDESVVILYVINDISLISHKDAIIRENEIHKDIIITNCTHPDKFTCNLVSSTVWISKFCSHVSFVLNIVDNSVVDLKKLVPFLKTFHLPSDTLLMCDFMMPRESSIFTSVPKGNHGYCSTSAFLTTPSVMRNLATTLQNNQERLKDAWLSEISSYASVPITTIRKLFTGSRKKPSMLKDIMSANYPNNDIMVAIVRSQIPERETILMHQTWHLIQAHHSHVNEQHQVLDDPIQSGSILTFAVILMLIDFSVILFIFALIFCKRRWKS